MHIDNLVHILDKGKLTIRNHPDGNSDYLGIGDSELISRRQTHEVTAVNSGAIYRPSENYLPFYFWYRSVMLYRIQTGWKVTKRSPNEIIHFVYRLSDIIDDIECLFTDGHGFAQITQWYDDITELKNLDWDAIMAKRWNNTEEDPDRKRRKQAEFWVKNELSLDKIAGIAVYNEACKEKVVNLCNDYKREIQVKIKPNYYY